MSNAFGEVCEASFFIAWESVQPFLPGDLQVIVRSKVLFKGFLAVCCAQLLATCAMRNGQTEASMGLEASFWRGGEKFQNYVESAVLLK